MRDRDVRTVLRYQLSKRYSNDPESVIVEEMGLRHGIARIDIAVINHVLHGYEIKSDRDNLERLPDQIRVYGQVFDRVTLVVGYRHAYDALRMVPEWWGVKLAEKKPSGNVVLADAREEENNPNLDLYSVASLLWRDEALNVLRDMGASKSMNSKPRSAIYSRLVEVCNSNELCLKVREQLRERVKQKADGQHMQYGG